MKNSLKLACAVALAATAAFAPAANAGYTTTKYPIVLVHGSAGAHCALVSTHHRRPPMKTLDLALLSACAR